MKQTVVAVIGCGRIANGSHFPALQALENVRIKYACDLIIEKAEAAKEKFPKIEETITDYKVALADPEVEAVFVLTPNYAHYTVTMDALRAGKDVLCEKPITVNYALSCEMAEEAKKQNKILNIGVCNRFQKSVVELAKMNAEGKFGNIYHVYCSFRSFRSIPGLGGAFTDKKQSGGGVLIDWGVHFLDLILFILGGAKLKNVTCDAYCEMAKDMKSYKYKSMWAEDTSDVENGVNDVDDFVTGYIRTDKASISFNGAWAQNLDKADMYIDFLGDKGGARLNYGKDFEFCSAETLETVVPPYEKHKMHAIEVADFIESVNDRHKSVNHIDYVLESAKLLDALYQSAEIQKEIAF
ncbi:MAG: Gfo/Idh/MocA family oxidoreductase [Ruminococcaceae bacterium]|nr:Gfo/Idh/MocA family oxidoreductase [Oscillospiraceae bacterium]